MKGNLPKVSVTLINTQRTPSARFVKAYKICYIFLHSSHATYNAILKRKKSMTRLSRWCSLVWLMIQQLFWGTSAYIFTLFGKKIFRYRVEFGNVFREFDYADYRRPKVETLVTWRIHRKAPRIIFYCALILGEEKYEEFISFCRRRKTQQAY